MITTSNSNNNLEKLEKDHGVFWVRVISCSFQCVKKIKENLVAALSISILLIHTNFAGAATITSLVGDIDGFGGQTALGSPPDGFSIQCCFDNRTINDPVFTDVWSFQLPEAPTVINYTHSYNPSSLLESVSLATLSVQSAGMGNNRGPWEVFFNGISVGDIGGPTATIGASEVATHIFNIPLILLAASGINQVSLIYQDTGADGFAINFSQLTVQAVPLPGGLILFLSAFGLLRACNLKY